MKSPEDQLPGAGDPVKPEELEGLNVGVLKPDSQTQEQEIAKLTESIEGTKTKLGVVREGLGLLPTGEEPPSIISEKGKKKILQERLRQMEARNPSSDDSLSIPGKPIKTRKWWGGRIKEEQIPQNYSAYIEKSEEDAQKDSEEIRREYISPERKSEFDFLFKYAKDSPARKKRIDNIAFNPKLNLDLRKRANDERKTLRPQDGIHFMSEEDNQEYNTLLKNDRMRAKKFLREKWEEKADKEYLSNNYIVIHWAGGDGENSGRLEQLLHSPKPDLEISTQAYRTGDLDQLKNDHYEGLKYGLLIGGDITLAANGKIFSHDREAAERQGGKKYSAWASNLITGEKDAINPYEFLIGNWRTKAIVADRDTPNLDRIKNLADKYKVPLVYTDDKSVFKI
jgi:hypothetical protein